MAGHQRQSHPARRSTMRRNVNQTKLNNYIVHVQTALTSEAEARANTPPGCVSNLLPSRSPPRAAGNRQDGGREDRGQHSRPAGLRCPSTAASALRPQRRGRLNSASHAWVFRGGRHEKQRNVAVLAEWPGAVQPCLTTHPTLRHARQAEVLCQQWTRAKTPLTRHIDLTAAT